MTKFRTLDHPMIGVIAWDPARPAEWINDHIAMVHATSNAYLITGDEGDVVINTGTGQQGPGVREKFERLVGRPLDVRTLIFTQSHPDHTGGWQTFAGPETRILGQRMFSQICAERKMLGSFFTPRNHNVLMALTPPGVSHAWFDTPDPEPMTTFGDELEFECSGRRYRLVSMWSGETLDALAVWLPDEKTVFTGNWAGAIQNALPNFYTPRGDRERSVPAWLKHCDALLAARPELLITGHEQPVAGLAAIEAQLGKVRDAVRFIHDETVTGMNAGRTVAEIMSAIALPPHLAPRDGRCPPAWIARAVYEEYAGWFHQERTSELYATAQTAIWPELVERAGGAGELAAMAQRHLTGGDPERALHLIEMASFTDPRSRAVREVELAVYEALADRTEGRIFDLLGWLEGRILATRTALAQMA